MNFLHIITPINLVEQEHLFFESTSYHPRFLYDWDRNEINAWLATHPYHMSIVRAIFDQETTQITDFAQVLFQVDWDEIMLDKARSFLNHTPIQLPPIPHETCVALFQEAMLQLKLDYQIILTDAVGFNVRPKTSRKVLEMSRGADHSFLSIEGEIRHELTHLVRHENTLLNSIGYSPDFLPTEEGLATYVQDFGGQEENYSAFQHAAEYAVTHICRNGSLRDAVNYLISIGFPPKLAWKRAVRHKFGFVDSSVPGDIMKPAMYFAHAQRVARLTPNERLRLFTGKISVTDLPAYPQYVGRLNQTALSSFFFGDTL